LNAADWLVGITPMILPSPFNLSVPRPGKKIAGSGQADFPQAPCPACRAEAQRAKAGPYFSFVKELVPTPLAVSSQAPCATLSASIGERVG
jgi:hypothetical protein